MDKPPLMALMLCDDLLFSSKLTATARALNLPASVARTVERLLKLTQEQPIGCILLDLHHTGLNLETVLPQLRQHGPRATVIGFGSHVDVETLKAARRAGCDQVMPRSQFSAELEAKLPTWCGVPFIQEQGQP